MSERFIEFPVELALIPRIPVKPEGVSIEDYQEALTKLGQISYTERRTATIIYDKRNKTMFLDYPPDEVH